MAGVGRTKTVPFRLLTYFLYGRYDWIEYCEMGVIRVKTGPASRALRVSSADLWEYLYWLETSKLVESVRKEHKRGTVLINLYLPTAFEDDEYYTKVIPQNADKDSV